MSSALRPTRVTNCQCDGDDDDNEDEDGDQSINQRLLLSNNPSDFPSE